MSATISPPMFLQFFIPGTGQPAIGYQLFTYVSGTSTKQATWTDYTQLVQNANPIRLDSNGVASVWLDPALSYKFIWTTPNDTDPPGSPIRTQDGIQGYATLGIFTQQFIGQILYPRTAAEISAGVTPTNYAYPAYTWLRYGADPTGITDSTTALQNAINAASAANHSMVTVGIPGGVFKVWSAWTIDVTQVGIDFQGAFINATGFTTGNWMSVVNTAATDVTQRQLLSTAHPIQNATAQGPGCQNAGGAVAQYLNDTNVFPTVAGVITRNFGFQDWPVEVILDAGTYCCTWEYCILGPTNTGSSGPATVYGIQSLPSSDAGEHNSFVGCTLYNRANAVNQTNPNADLHFDLCRFDYASGRVITVTAGNVFITNPHIESNTDTDYWFSVTGTNSGLSVKGGVVLVTLPKTAFSPFYCDSSTTNNGVSLDDVFLGITSANSIPSLCAGTGVFTARNLKTYFNSWRGVLSTAANKLAYGDFESTSYTVEWTLVNGATRSTAQHHNGTASLSFPSTSAASAGATAKFPCSPGAMVQGVFWYLYPTRTNGTLFVEGAFYDAGGNVIANTPALTLTSSQATWTEQSFTVQGQAPPGAYYAGLSISLFGVVTGTETGYIDDVVLNVTNP